MYTAFCLLAPGVNTNFKKPGRPQDRPGFLKFVFTSTMVSDLVVGQPAAGVSRPQGHARLDCNQGR